MWRLQLYDCVVERVFKAFWCVGKFNSLEGTACGWRRRAPKCDGLSIKQCSLEYQKRWTELGLMKIDTYSTGNLTPLLSNQPWDTCTLHHLRPSHPLVGTTKVRSVEQLQNDDQRGKTEETRITARRISISLNTILARSDAELDLWLIRQSLTASAVTWLQTVKEWEKEKEL